jgi:hypothetical protein
MGCDGAACKHLPLGAACTTGTDCDSGSCADGVCCNLGCAGTCVSCNQPGSAGQCLPVAAGTSDPRGICKDEGAASCGLTGSCNGQGGCARYAAGSVCKPSSCAGGSMIPAGTCDGRGTCLEGAGHRLRSLHVRRHGLPGHVHLRRRLRGRPPPARRGSCGKRGLGQACQSAEQCKSGFCADGVCCSEACTGKCRFCALSVAPRSLRRRPRRRPRSARRARG